MSALRNGLPMGIIGSLVECPSEYSFQLEDVCVSGMNCKVNVPRLNMVNTPIRCPCPETHSFQCGLNGCTINDVACDALRIRIRKEEKVNFNKCLNGNKKFENS